MNDEPHSILPRTVDLGVSAPVGDLDRLREETEVAIDECREVLSKAEPHADFPRHAARN